MLNIGRMAPGGHDYYLEVVARGVEDYYLARGEAPGQWLRRGVELLGLQGRVEGAELAAVLAGDDPSTGVRLAAHPARKVPGFDLTFRAPKSVSLLWALADDRVGEEVREAHDAAVAAAVGYLEREAGWTRRGAGGCEAVRGCRAAAYSAPRRPPFICFGRSCQRHWVARGEGDLGAARACQRRDHAGHLQPRPACR